MDYRISLISILFIAVSLANENPEIKVKQGIIKGKTLITEKGTKFHLFTGIPYAKPPIEELRFQPPQPIKSWIGVLDATKSHNICPQPVMFKNNTIIGNEDCLYLNVYTPQLPEDEIDLLPVMFYIHGGAWVSGHAGSDLNGPDLLIDKNVVLVTTNYRLGILGFLTTGNELIAGNNGLKDQSLAIKWTKENIERFGGDPNKITVFGQSAGGASAHYHMLSPLSRDLINAVIAQSGTALTTWALAPIQLIAMRSKIVAGFCGCNTFKMYTMFNCLMKLDAYEMIKQSMRLLQTDVDPMMLFKPIIEPPYIEEPFLVEDPIDIIKSGKAASVPFITGLTTDEGAIRTVSLYKQPELLEKLDKEFTEFGPMMLTYGESIPYQHKLDVHEKVRKFYFKNKPIDQSTASQFTKAFSDAVFLLGAEAAIDLHSTYSKEAVYYYLFGYKGSASYCRLLDQDNTTEDYGVCHCDDLLYLFKNNELFPHYKPTESDQEVSELMTTLWTNFAKEGNPTPEKEPGNVIKWEPVEENNKKYYFINSAGKPSVEKDMFKQRAKFWRELPIDSRRIKIRDEL